MKREEGNSVISEVTAETYVGSDGLVVSALSFRVKDAFRQPEDFLLELQYAPREYMGENTCRLVTASAKKIEIRDDMIRAETEEIPIPFLEKMRIRCGNIILDCTPEVLRFRMRTADEFIPGTYTAEDGTEISYYLYLPDGSTDLPLMIWEHGGGEALSLSSPGANLTANRGAVAWIENGFETAVLSVQYPGNYSFGITGIPEEFEKMKAFGKAKYELIQKLIKEGKVDPARIYISGCSSGGGASLRMIMQYPDLFAGALVICAKDTIVPISKSYGFAYQFGGNDLLKLSEEAYEEVYAAMEKEMEKVDITSTPIWFVQAEHDQICTSYTSRILFDILKKQGAPANRLTIWSDEEMEALGMPRELYHGTWVPVLENKEMLSWVYDQHK